MPEIMRLSDAIRLGTMLRPQTHEQLWSTRGSCALGAALQAVGCTPLPGESLIPPEVQEMFLAWKNTLPRLVNCPQCAFHHGPPLELITHLNDRHRWKRERIADWVDAQERAQPGMSQLPADCQDGAAIDA